MATAHITGLLSRCALIGLAACLTIVSGGACVMGGDIEPRQPEPAEVEPVEPLPRLEIRDSDGDWRVFYNTETGERFYPEGYNHTVLGRGGWHATFSVGEYEAREMEDTLSAIADTGANVIRVWAWGENVEGEGVTGPSESQGLNAEYMENFVDFLQRCTRHGLYVLPILDERPTNQHYSAIVEAHNSANATAAINGHNRLYLAPGPVAAKAALARDFVRYVKDSDPGLLHTILGWQLANESNVHADLEPFDRTEGEATTANGETYDMSDEDSRQACWDDGVVHWANQLTRAIRKVDPGALVTTGMWTADAHGREPYNGLLDPEPDPRIPPRPSVLASGDCLLDFLDIHIYPWDDIPVVRPEAHEWDALRDAGIPVIVGEYGAFRRTEIREAAQWIRSLREQAYDMGYQGSLFWTWNLDQDSVYNAQEDELLHITAPANGPLGE
ncbi:MAG: cellulase family glycosylhydrolase [Candidatus Hydrogenedentota bacterium]